MHNKEVLDISVKNGARKSIHCLQLTKSKINTMDKNSNFKITAHESNFVKCPLIP